MPLYRDLLNFLRLTLVGKPGMGKIGSYQYQFQLIDRFDMIADNTPTGEIDSEDDGLGWIDIPVEEDEEEGGGVI